MNEPKSPSEDKLKHLKQEYKKLVDEMEGLRWHIKDHEHKTCNNEDRVKELERRYMGLGGDVQDLKEVLRLMKEKNAKHKGTTNGNTVGIGFLYACLGVAIAYLIWGPK